MAAVTPVWRSLGYTRTMIRAAKKCVLSRTSQIFLWPTGMFLCDAPQCSVCPFADCSTTFSHPSANVSYPILSRITCTSSNVIYIVRCKVCASMYVGQTRRLLRSRIARHLHNIRSNHLNAPLYRHFRSCGIDNFTFKGIEIQPRDSRRLQREEHWISTLRTRFPLGLNVATRKKASSNLILPFSYCARLVTSAVKRWCGGRYAFCASFRRARNLGELLSRQKRQHTS